MTFDDTYDAPAALGRIVEEGRGALVFELIHGESLVACAAWALGEARVTAVDLGTAWEDLVDSAKPFVVHDVLCPMTPAAFIAECVARVVESGAVVVAVDAAGVVLSPIVLPASAVAELSALPSLDFAELVTCLDERFVVDRLLAPPGAARVTSAADVAALEADTAPEQP